MYAGNPINFCRQHLLNIITGQGADSLYTIDAPLTETIGFQRTNLINKTASYRADLTRDTPLRNLNLENNNASFSKIQPLLNFNFIQNHFNFGRARTLRFLTS